MTHPSNNLLRAYCAPDAVELRDTGDGDGNTLTGHFAVFNEWTEINSRYEGNFVERIAPGAFARTIERDSVKVLYDHGKDPSVGNKPLGVPSSITEDAKGVRYEVPLFDAGYVNDLKPAIRAGALGASFRFSVPEGGDTWVTPTRSADHNPDRLAERTITEVKLFEFGPVTFPAYAGATAGMRSTTDEFLDGLLGDPLMFARFTDRVGLAVVEKIMAELPEDLRAANTEHPAEDLADVTHSHARRQWLAANIYGRKTA